MNTQERALEKAKEKVEALLWESPEGLTISNITGDLRISVPLAKSALKAIGAVYEGGVWVLHDDDVAAVDVAEPAIGITDTSPTPVSQPVEKQETGIPVSEEKQSVEPESKTVTVVTAEPDWANAPCGSTHYSLVSGTWLRANDIGVAVWFGERWCLVPTGTKRELDDAVMVLKNPNPVELAVIKACTYRNGTYECRGDGYLWDADADGWDPIYKDWPCPACNKEEYDRDMAETEQDEPTPTKSDFALAVEAEREKVLTVIQSGATLARVVEVTGLHIDDAQHHVDVLVDMGRVVARPVVVAVAYEVVA